jgi:glycosyltransferase involved in cell wall biosynthesis
MIVKDEEAVIERCLASVKPYIDSWVIVDTGSSDRTIEIIKDYLKDIPGELHQCPWKNFGFNRTQALELAKNFSMGAGSGKADYLLFMDADDWLEYNFQGNQGHPFPELTKEAYQMWRGTKDFAYLKPQLVKTNLAWKWVGVTHEYLIADRPYTAEVLASVYYTSGDKGARNNDPQKYWKNVALLEQGLKDEPHNERYMFYLAESYRDAGAPEKALEAYETRVSVGGWDEEVFCSLLNIAKLKERLGRQTDEVIAAYYRAHCYRPARVEPIYYLAHFHNQNSRSALAYEIIKAWQALPKSSQKDFLFNEAWVDRWGLLFEFSICSYHVGKYQESLAACDKLLEMGESLPAHIRERTVLNKQFPYDKLFPAGMIALAEPVEKSVKQIKAKGAPKGKKVLIAILAKDKAHVLPYFLHCIENLDYDKRLITVYINTNNNTDGTKEILQTWAEKNEKKYCCIDFDYHEVEALAKSNPHEWNSQRFNVLGHIRNKSLAKTIEHKCDFYFVVDCDNFIAPFTLKELVKLDKPMVAPMLRGIPYPNDSYSNFFTAVDERGYYRQHPQYFRILNHEIKGTFEVPLIHTTYLIKAECLDKLTYVDATDHHEFVILARSARENGIRQYICNEKQFGLILNFYGHLDLDRLTLEEENKHFQHYLKMQKYCSELKL